MATNDMIGVVRRPMAAGRSGPSLQVAGGIAALLEGLAYIANAVLILIVLPNLGMKESYYDEPSQFVPFVAAHHEFFVLGALVFVIAAVIVLPVVLALHDRLQALSPGLITMATVLGVVAMAMLLLNALVQYAEFHAAVSLSSTVAEQALAGGSLAYDATEHAATVCLGLWTVLLSSVVIGRGGLPRWLGYFGILVGLADLLALFGPPIGPALSIVWFLAVGIVLVRAPLVAARSESEPMS